MAVHLNPDKEVVATVKEGLKRTGGYCPCHLERTEDTKCMCKEFRDQIADPNFATVTCIIRTEKFGKPCPEKR